MATFELRLLGKPAVWLEGHEVALPTKKALGLLAYLALEGPTPRSKLADLLWSEMDEDTARKNLRQEFHRLQNTPLTEHLILTPSDIRLGGEPNTDVKAFQQRIVEHDWDGALKLYHGSLLESLELRGAERFEEWLESSRATLAGEYRKALRHRAGQLEQGGNLRAALESYRILLAAEPFEEHTYCGLMRLHALLGEREAALEVYRRCARMLEREFALKPLPETAKLAERIRTSQLYIPSSTPPSTPKTPNLNPPLVGREREWERLERAFAEGRVAYVAGEAGVGKSRLLREFGLSKGGYDTLQGHPSDLSVPYSTLTRGMRSLLETYKPHLEPWERRELSRLLPELSQALPPPIQSEFERLRLFDAYSEVFWRATQQIPLMIREDIHWFDPASSELAQYMEIKLAESGRRNRSFASFRPEELNPPAWAMIRATAQAGQAEVIELAPLSEVGVAQLVSRLSGEPVTVFPRRVYQAIGGNPFFVLETLKGLFESGELWVSERGAWSTDYDEETEDYRELPIPQSVKTAVLERVERQGARFRRLLEVASLISRPFRLEDLTGVTALGEWEALEALEGAQEAGLVRVSDPGYGFAHDLIRRTLEESLSPERRRLIHRRLAETLEKAGAEPARVALHLEKGGREAEAGRWWAKAGEAALRVFAVREAYSQFGKALSLLPPDAKGRFELLEQHERLAYDLGEREAEAGDLEELERLARTPAEKGRLALRRYALLSITGQPTEAHAAAQEALGRFAEAGDELGRAEALFHLAEADYYREDFIPGLERARIAVQLTQGRAPALFVRACNLVAFFEGAKGDLEAALAAYGAALKALHSHPNPVLEARTLNNRASLQRYHGSFAAALADVDRALEIARQVGMRQFEGFALETRVRALQGLRRLGEAWADLETALALARSFKSARLEADFLQTKVGLLGDLGQPKAALEAADEALQAALGAGSSTNRILILTARAEARLHLGQPQGALEDAAEAQRRLEAQGGLRANLPEGVRLTYIRALLANRRGEEASAVLERARAEMLARGERIHDPKLRQNYLNLRVNQELLNLKI